MSTRNFCIAGVLLLGACGVLHHQTDQDKIDTVTIPDGVVVHYFTSRYDYQKFSGKLTCGNYVITDGQCHIYLVRKYEVLLHELEHCDLGPFHGGRRYYVSC